MLAKLQPVLERECMPKTTVRDDDPNDDARLLDVGMTRANNELNARTRTGLSALIAT